MDGAASCGIGGFSLAPSTKFVITCLPKPSQLTAYPMPGTIVYTTEQKTVQFTLSTSPVWVRTQAVTSQVITRAETVLSASNLAGGTPAAQAILPPGWGSGGCPEHHNRGHLIGNRLGGPGSDASNLVTLTAGTNHPFMYEYEEALRRYVEAHAKGGVTVRYKVECVYEAAAYTLTPGFPVPGASGNPFCLFPAPAGLELSAILVDQNGHPRPLTLRDLADELAIPAANLGLAASYKKLCVPNGGYKLYSSLRHVKNSCFAAPSTSYASVANEAISFAKKLGHLP